MSVLRQMDHPVFGAYLFTNILKVKYC